MVSVTQTITLTAVPTLTENTTLGGELTWDKLNKFQKYTQSTKKTSGFTGRITLRSEWVGQIIFEILTQYHSVKMFQAITSHNTCSVKLSPHFDSGSNLSLSMPICWETLSRNFCQVHHDNELSLSFCSTCRRYEGIIGAGPQI